ncbi:MAG: hypothetical protein HY755_03985 [Nitrospirae bacterium]|nr:hypothetical protein [Nitrospirota bacterium]
MIKATIFDFRGVLAEEEASRKASAPSPYKTISIRMSCSYLRKNPYTIQVM